MLRQDYGRIYEVTYGIIAVAALDDLGIRIVLYIVQIFFDMIKRLLIDNSIQECLGIAYIIRLLVLQFLMQALANCRPGP